MPTALNSFLLFILLTTLCSTFIGADDKFIDQKCRDTDVPAVCIQCIKSDPSGEKADKGTDIAAIAIKCLNDHADILVRNMSTLASEYSSDEKLVRVCESCSKGYSNAKKSLSKADGYLKSGEYDNANHFLTFALDDELVQGCEPSLEPYRERTVIGSDVFYQMKIYEDLTGIAMAIIDRFAA